MNSGRKIFIFLVIACLPGLGLAQAVSGSFEKRDPAPLALKLDGREWLKTQAAQSGKAGDVIERKDAFEVPASILLALLSSGRLSEAAGVEALTTEQARRLVGEHYECGSELRPYLVRAVFIPGRSDPILVRRTTEGLLITHTVFGFRSIEPVMKTAFVVNLPFTPKTVALGVWWEG